MPSLELEKCDKFSIAQAYEALHEYARAIADLETLLAVEPENTAAREKMKTCKAHVADDVRREKDMYSKMFK